VRSQLNDLLDGSLDTPARQRLERHLVQCTDCEALRRTLEQTVQGLGGLGPIRTPTGMRDRLRQRLKDQESAE
jgi:anti-sigma factor RsiW